jgi:hypothetical protein
MFERDRHLALQHLKHVLELVAFLIKILVKFGVGNFVGNISFDLFDALFFRKTNIAESLPKGAESSEVLFVSIEGEISEQLTVLVRTGLDRGAALGDELLDHRDAADREVAVVDGEFKELLVLAAHVEELLVLDLALLLAVVLVDAALDLLEALGAELLEEALELLDLAPRLVLLLEVLADELVALVLLPHEALHRLGVLEVGLLDRVVEVLEVLLAALLEAALGVLHGRGLLERLLLHVVDLGEHAVLVVGLADDAELVLDELDEALEELRLDVELLLGDRHLTVRERDVADLLGLLDRGELRLDLLLVAHERGLHDGDVHALLEVLEDRDGDLRELGRVELRAAELLLDLLELGDAVVDDAGERDDARLVAVLLELVERLLEADDLDEVGLVLGLEELADRHLEAADAHELLDVVRGGEGPLGAGLDGLEELGALLVRGVELLLLRLGPLGQVEILDELLVLEAGGLQLEVVDLLLAGGFNDDVSDFAGHFLRFTDFFSFLKREIRKSRITGFFFVVV